MSELTFLTILSLIQHMKITQFIVFSIGIEYIFCFIVVDIIMVMIMEIATMAVVTIVSITIMSIVVVTILSMPIVGMVLYC